MSSFLGGTDGSNGVTVGQAPDDGRLRPEWADDTPFRWIDQDACYSLSGYRSSHWPGSQLDASGNEWLGLGPCYDYPEVGSGANSRVRIMGITRDGNGNPLGLCDVKLFKSTDGTAAGTGTIDTKIDESTSDANGNYTLLTPNADTHYVVAYLASNPDVMGTTLNTLVGA